VSFQFLFTVIWTLLIVDVHQTSYLLFPILDWLIKSTLIDNYLKNRVTLMILLLIILRYMNATGQESYYNPYGGDFLPLDNTFAVQDSTVANTEFTFDPFQPSNKKLYLYIYIYNSFVRFFHKNEQNLKKNCIRRKIQNIKIPKEKVKS